MTVPTSATATRVGGRLWTPAPGEAHDRCWRCGRPTPLGISLCDDDNPGRIGAPSSTQVHGTIFVGVIAGFVLLALVGRLAVGSVGPFSSAIQSAVTREGGELDVVVSVTNQGASATTSTCRISRGGLAAPGDPVFMTARIPAGQTIDVSHRIPAPARGRPAFAIDRLTVFCR